MSKLQGEILTFPKISGSVSTPKSLSGNVGAKTINIGSNGDGGATFIPSVSADGVISWTNDKGLPNPEPVNIKGVNGKTPEYGVDYGTPEQISEIAQSAADILQPDVSQIKRDLADLAPAGAAVGQLFRVAAIREGGGYIMEPVGMLASGENWVTICDVTTEEEISKFSVKTYQGDPLSLSQYTMEIFIPNGTEATNLNGKEWHTIDDCRIAMSASSLNGGFYLYQDYNPSKHLKSKVIVCANYNTLNRTPFWYSDPIVNEVYYANFQGDKLPIGTRFIIKGVLA